MKLRWIRDGTGTLYAFGAMNMDTSQRIVRLNQCKVTEGITRGEIGEIGETEEIEETHGEIGEEEEAKVGVADKEEEGTNKGP